MTFHFHINLPSLPFQQTIQIFYANYLFSDFVCQYSSIFTLTEQFSFYSHFPIYFNYPLVLWSHFRSPNYGKTSLSFHSYRFSFVSAMWRLSLPLFYIRLPWRFVAITWQSVEPTWNGGRIQCFAKHTTKKTGTVNTVRKLKQRYACCTIWAYDLNLKCVEECRLLGCGAV
jgi:hypothetical protein